MNLNELADALDSYAPGGDGYNTPYSHNLQEAAAILRAAAGADVDDLMEQAQAFASAWALVGGRFDLGDGLRIAEEEKAALETRLRLLVAQLPKQYRQYTTEAGESLAGIALRQLKDETRWVEIRDLNAHQHPDMWPNDYYPVGTVLRLPLPPAPKEVETS